MWSRCDLNKIILKQNIKKYMKIWKSQSAIKTTKYPFQKFFCNFPVTCRVSRRGTNFEEELGNSYIGGQRCLGNISLSWHLQQRASVTQYCCNRLNQLSHVAPEIIPEEHRLGKCVDWCRTKLHAENAQLSYLLRMLSSSFSSGVSRSSGSHGIGSETSGYMFQ